MKISSFGKKHVFFPTFGGFGVKVMFFITARDFTILKTHLLRWRLGHFLRTHSSIRETYVGVCWEFGSVLGHFFWPLKRHKSIGGM